jgi:hypothetical protein
MAKDKEIVSFNTELANFDFDDVTVEELEQRLELAVGAVNTVGGTCTGFSGSCTGFSGQCNTF